MEGKGYRYDCRMDNVKEITRKHLKTLLAFIQKRGIILGILAMLGVGYGLAASGRPQDQLSPDRQVTFSKEEAYLKDFLAKSDRPEVGVNLEKLLEFKIGDATLVPSTKGTTPETLVEKLGGAKQARLESKARTQLLRLSYGTTQDGRDRYQFEFTHMKDGYYLTAIQGYQPSSKHNLESKQLKKAALTSLASGKEKAGIKLEDILQKVGLPQSLLLNHKDGKTVLVLTYRVQEGLVFLTLQPQKDTRYHLVKVE